MWEDSTMRLRTIGLLLTLALGFLVVQRAAEAQPPAKVYRLGVLRVGTPPFAGAQFLEELRRLGYVEGHNLLLEHRVAETREQLPTLAAELVTRKVDLILTRGTPATRAAKQATSTIPIVFSLSTDPVQSRLVASYAWPGGNVTGFVGGLYGDKQLEILKEAVPGIARVACPCRRSQQKSQLVAAARALGLELQDINIQRPANFARFFAVAQRAGTDAVLIPDVAGFGPYLPRLAKLVTQSRLPAIGFFRRFAESGGLLSYGPQQEEGTPRVAAMVDKILKGAKPADIPVERHMHFELVVNLKTAETLGLTLSPLLLSRADEVIR
jgi:putative ABC transport system substrate-binding protein